MCGLAISYSGVGRRQEAMELREKVLEARQRTLGNKHPNTLLAMNNVAIHPKNSLVSKKHKTLSTDSLEEVS